MNNLGQTFGVFRLAIFAIVTLVIIFIVSSFFIEEERNTIEELLTSLDFAESNPGTGVIKQILIEKDFAVNAKNVFDSPQRSVSFKCDSLYCTQNIFQVSSRNLIVKDQISIQYTTRCVFEKNLFNCKIYFGTSPAQLVVSGVTIKENFDLESETVDLKFLIKNIGAQNAAEVITEVKIFKQGTEEGKPIENLYSDSVFENTKLIETQKEIEVNLELPIKDSGEYAVEINTSGLDAGVDSKRATFFAQGNISSSNCKANEKLDTFLNETLNQCITRYTCSGCEFAFECMAIWEEIQPETLFESSSKDATLELVEPINGSC